MSGNPQAYLAAGDFTANLIALLPPGMAWQGSTMALLLAGCGDAFGDLHAFLAQITELEMVPATAVQLLPEWEADFGLPDCCSPLGATTVQRQTSLVAKMQARGGQSAPYFIALAASLGFPGCTVSKYDVTRCGARCGARTYSSDWRFVWTLNVPFAASTGAELICRVTAYQPASGVVTFNFSS